jgi:crotonobetainyl-CoA:carnitine CoA-transferase CaiB-like acyl-CoA transferase
MAMAGALDGIRVSDFGQYIAGPLAAVMLGDQGADVRHLDPPGGPRWQHPAEAFLNRGKRRITLDLKTAAGVATAQRLIDSADVVIMILWSGSVQPVTKPIELPAHWEALR